MERRIKPWVNKKIVEYIGEPEPTLVEFICSKVLIGSQPQSIIDDVQMVTILITTFVYFQTDSQTITEQYSSTSFKLDLVEIHWGEGTCRIYFAFFRIMP